jgi:transcriptional regulator with XRE-family HTH domain
VETAETVAWLRAQAEIERKKALAARLGVDDSYLIKVLRNERNPSISLLKICAMGLKNSCG